MMFIGVAMAKGGSSRRAIKKNPAGRAHRSDGEKTDKWRKK
jgi:hypothetical protein